MTNRPSSKDRILDAAEAIALDRGARHMSLDAVAAKAGISKGGVLYHFPGQRHLLHAMITRLMDHVETRAARAAATLPPTPARDLKAGLHAWLTLGREHRSLAGALLAAITREPTMLKAVRERRRAKLSALLARIPNPEKITPLLLALEGLWMSEVLGLTAFAPAERSRIRRELLRKIDEACSDAPTRHAPEGHGKTRNKPRIIRKSAKTCCAILCCLLGLASQLAVTAEEPQPPAAAATAKNGQDLRKYTLQDCLQIGMERAVVLANARRDEQIAMAKKRQAASQAWPHLALNGIYTRIDKLDTVAFGEQSMEIGKLNTYSAGAQADQLLYSGGVVWAAIRAARQYQRFSAQNTAAVRSELVRDITQGFYGVIFARAAVKVRQESVNHLKDFLEQTELKYKNDAVSEFDLLSAQVRLSNELPLLILATNQLDVAKEAYRNLVNLDEGPFDLEGSLDIPPVAFDIDALMELAFKNRPELQRIAAQINMLREDIAAERSAYHPTIRAFGKYTASNASGMGSSAEDNEWDADWHWSVGLVAQWDIFDGGLRRGKVVEKRLALEKAIAAQGDLERGIRLQVKQAFLDLQRSAEAVASTQGGVELARKALALANVRFQQGISTYLEFTETNLALSRAQLTHIEALKEYACALAAVNFACGSDAPANGEHK